MVPCAFVSRGIISTRMAGSSQRGCSGVSLSRDSAVTASYPGLLLRLRLLIDQLLADDDRRRFAQPLQQRRAEAPRFLLAQVVGVLRPVLRGRSVIGFLLLGDLEQHRTVAGHDRTPDFAPRPRNPPIAKCGGA